MNRILAENTGKPLKTIEKDTERDNFMTAQEALEYGLIDKIYENVKKTGPQANGPRLTGAEPAGRGPNAVYARLWESRVICLLLHCGFSAAEQSDDAAFANTPTPKERKLSPSES